MNALLTLSSTVCLSFLFCLSACTPAPPPPAPAAPHPAPPRPSGAGAQAARAAPVNAAKWSGAWTLRLLAEPQDGGSAALSAALGQPVQAWQGGRPPTRPGEVAILWLGAEFPAAGLLQRLHGPGPGEVIAIIAAPEAAWREEIGAALPWQGVSVVDPRQSLALWADPSGASGALLGLTAAFVLAEHYRAPFTPQPGPWPPVAAVWLGPPQPLSTDLPILAEQARRGGPEIEAAAAALVTDADPAVRLGLSVRVQQQAILLRLSADPEPMIRARAADRLQDLPRLRELLSDPSSLVRVVAAHRLLQAGDAPGLAIAARSPDAYVRWKAAAGLTDPGLLSKLLADPDIDVRRAAALQAGSLTKIPPELERALIAGAADSNSFVRRWCMEGLAKAQTPAAQAALRVGLKDSTLLVAAAAAKSLSAQGTYVATAPFVPQGPPADDNERDQRALSMDATVRKDLCKFLADRPASGESSLRWLEPLSRDPDSEVRKSAVEAMGWRAEEESAFQSALLAAVADPDPDVRITALEGLRRARAGQPDLLLPLLTDADAEIRLRAAEALAAMPAPPPELRARSNDPDERIRAAVVRAFPDALRPDDPSLLVRWTAALLALPPEEQYRIRGILAREDDLLHERFSWNRPEDRPAAYRSLRPPVIREYGHPDRG